MTQIFLTHISTRSSLPSPARGSHADQGTRYSPRLTRMPHALHFSGPSLHSGRIRDRQKAEQPISQLPIILSSFIIIIIIIIIPAIYFDSIPCVSRTPALWSRSDPRSPAQLPVTDSRPVLALSLYPQFPEEALTFLLLPPLPYWIRTQAVLVMSHWPQTSGFIFSLARLLAESRESSRVISSSVSSC